MSSRRRRSRSRGRGSSQPQNSCSGGGDRSGHNTYINSGGNGVSGGGGGGGGGVSGGTFNAPIIGFTAGGGGGMNSTYCAGNVGGDPAHLLATANQAVPTRNTQPPKKSEI